MVVQSGAGSFVFDLSLCCRQSNLPQNVISKDSQGWKQSPMMEQLGWPSFTLEERRLM